jgi:hypothetical protein
MGITEGQQGLDHLSSHRDKKAGIHRSSTKEMKDPFEQAGG